ncbi:response regulator [Persephonella sp.]|uniref:response regulator n=1 Tax=Persephonella sp. TaxID=2060922 RepID=UPI0025E1019E|nr:response regulator [Persephonella sp.]
MNSIGKILVVEDSKTMNNIIANKLKDLGFSVQSAFSLKEADKYLDKNRYDLIILDLHLPDGEGSDLIMDIRSITNTKIIILTSVKDEYLRDELFKYGILDYIVKDKNLQYSLEEIIKIIKHIKKKERDKILVIDDSRFVCKQVKRVLEPRNYIVETTSTGKEGLQKLQQGNFSLVVLDMELPDIHGTQLLQTIREDRRFIKLPVLVLSGTADAETVRYILKNGASDYLRKPFIFEEFLLRVDLWVDYYKQSKELDEKTDQLEELNKNLEERIKQETLKNLEKDRLLFAKSRLAEIGQMMSAIAHQWKQPLNSLSALISRTYLRYQLNNNSIDKQTMDFCFENANLQIQDMSETITNFMNFFKPDKEKEIFNLYSNIRRTIKLIKNVLKSSGIELEVDVDRSIYVEGYPNEFGQIILNMINNSKDAFLERNISDRKIKISAKENNNNIKIFIEDTAGGIPESIKTKIFEPYFTTKNSNGTGLGLYICKLIVENYMRGGISVKNTGKGARFEIKLPKIKQKTT